MVSPYDARTEETRSRIMGGRRFWRTNKYYKSAEGDFYFYINTKGYFHIIKPCRITYNGEFSHFEISDCLLTRDNMVQEVSSRGYYKTKEEVIGAIEINLAEPD